MSRVVLDHVSKVFRGPGGHNIKALDDASFTVEDGELLVLVGPSGCGKTTTLRLIAGLEELTSGAIAIDGHTMNGVAPRDRDVSMVFQNHALYPHMTVFENLAFGLKVRKVSRGEIEQRVRGAATILELGDCLGRSPGELSGGQRQRVALGRAVVLQPRLFLLDEPLSNLDPQMRAQLRTELRKLHTRLGATMIYVTHEQLEAMTLGDRIAVLRDGKIQQLAPPLELYRKPANLFVAGFIGSPPMNFFHGVITASGNRLIFKNIASASESSLETRATPAGALPELPLGRSVPAGLARYDGQQAVLGLRPEDISLASEPICSAPGSAVEATVESVEPLGSETHLHLSRGGQLFIIRAAPFIHLPANHHVTLSFDMTKARFFDPMTGCAIG